MNDDVFARLRELRAAGGAEEEVARALLDLTLRAAPPEVADAVRVCALPAWFDAEILALLLFTPPSSPPQAGGIEGGKEAALLEKVAAFSFVLPRLDGRGYVYHEATRERLLDWWRAPQNRARFAALGARLAAYYLALAEEQDERLGGPDYLAALAALDAAYPNLRAAWQIAVETGNQAAVRDFAHTLANYLPHRRLWADWLALAQAARKACAQLGDERGAAAMHNNLGVAYRNLPTGDRAVNLQQAIACYREALRFYTPQATPLAYAAAQNNLGNAYADLPGGALAANLQKAIACYQEALRFCTPQTAPLAYAWTQNNLGEAYRKLPTGDRRENLAQATACYEESWRFRTPNVPFPDYVMIRNKLGIIYMASPKDDHASKVKPTKDPCERLYRRHWWYLVDKILFGLFGLAVVGGLSWLTRWLWLLVLSLIPLGWLILQVIRWRSQYLYFEHRRLVFHRWPTDLGEHINFAFVDWQFNQTSLWAELWNYGTLQVGKHTFEQFWPFRQLAKALKVSLKTTAVSFLPIAPDQSVLMKPSELSTPPLLESDSYIYNDIPFKADRPSYIGLLAACEQFLLPAGDLDLDDCTRENPRRRYYRRGMAHEVASFYREILQRAHIIDVQDQLYPHICDIEDVRQHAPYFEPSQEPSQRL